MKTIISTAIISASLAIPAAAQASDNYINYIIQTENLPADADPETEVEVVQFDNLDANGSMLASPVGPHGATFELITFNTDTNVETPIADLLASSFSPQATIEIETEDPYAGDVARTRVDKKFRARIAISGLLSPGEGVEIAATSVNFEHNITPDGKATQAVPGNYTSYSENNTYYSDPEPRKTRISSVPTPEIEFDLVGQETFKVVTNRAFGQNGTTDLDSKSIDIYPVPTASISGANETTVYNRLPDLQLVFNDIYPSATVWLRFVPVNAPDAGSENIDILDTSKEAPVGPGKLGYADFVASSSNLDSLVTKPGKYRMEIVHRTSIWGEEVLFSQEINKKTSVNINANIGTSE